MRSLHLRVYTLAVVTVLLAAGPAPGQVVAPTHPDDTHHQITKSKQKCEDCHHCENPTSEDPCIGKCHRHSSDFHGMHQVDEGPKVVIIDQLADLYQPVVFDHRMHARMSAMGGGCENCHHYSDTDGVIPPCRECHDAKNNDGNLRQPTLKGAYHRQCINCHLDWSNENSCSFCHEHVPSTFATSEKDTTDIVGIPHPSITAPPTFSYETSCKEGKLVTFHHNDHVEIFGLACVDCHKGDTCARCHASQPKPTTTMKNVTSCCSCHGERNCGFCHSDQPRPEFHHAVTTGWGLEPFHADVACEVCHGKPAAFHTPSSRCESCHIHWQAGSFDHAVTGVTLDEMHADFDCEDCHAERNFRNPPSCDDCHDEPMFPGQVPGTRR